jgi:hypothetical protein
MNFQLVILTLSEFFSPVCLSKFYQVNLLRNTEVSSESVYFELNWQEHNI